MRTLAVLAALAAFSAATPAQAEPARPTMPGSLCGGPARPISRVAFTDPTDCCPGHMRCTQFLATTMIERPKHQLPRT